MLTVSELLVFVNNDLYRITKHNACIISYCPLEFNDMHTCLVLLEFDEEISV